MKTYGHILTSDLGISVSLSASCRLYIKMKVYQLFIKQSMLVLLVWVEFWLSFNWRNCVRLGSVWGFGCKNHEKHEE